MRATLTESLTIRVSEKTKAALEQMAQRDDRTLAALVRKIIRDALDRQDKETDR